MTLTPISIPSIQPLPNHLQLPEENGEFVKNFQEHPQSILLTDSLTPILERLHPEGDYAIGQDCGIYWRQTDPPERGAEAPDWFYVPEVPPKLDGQIRRSYVIWQEHIAPTIALEFASGDGSAERDRTPLFFRENENARPGKFWVYERILRIPYYGIYQIHNQQLEVYRLIDGNYQPLEPNERGNYVISSMGVELGLWEGSYQNQRQRWLRWWDIEGNILLTGSERAEAEAQRAEAEAQRAEAEAQRANLAEQERDAEARMRREAIPQLLAMGLTIEQVAEALSFSVDEVRQLTVDR